MASYPAWQQNASERSASVADAAVALREGAAAVHPRPPRVLVIDNYDSFTYNLVHYLEAQHARVDVVLNDRIDLAAILRAPPDGVLVSPGPGGPDGAGMTPLAIRRLVGTIPLFGVCLGHQALARHFGARVGPAARLMHGKTSRIFHEGSGLFAGLPSPFVAARYHSLAVASEGFPRCLRVTARTERGEIMALEHVTQPTLGVQFHPESVASQYGQELLFNWLGSLRSGPSIECDIPAPVAPVVRAARGRA